MIVRATERPLVDRPLRKRSARTTTVAILAAMSSARVEPAAELLLLRDRVDRTLEWFLDQRRRDLAAIDPAAAGALDDVIALVRAGGKRLRPAFCYWGYRAAGGADGEPIIRAAAALEMLHTMALIHDDVMDGTAVRRGAPATHVRRARESAAAGGPDPERVGRALAILAGDLAAVLADQLASDAGFPADRLVEAQRHYHRMRVSTAAGQYLDLVSGSGGGRAARLRGAAYTVEGPLVVGAALAGGADEVIASLRGYGAPLGEAFQLLDDLRDGDVEPGATRGDALALVDVAAQALDRRVLDPAAVDALVALAELVGAG
jgi:geranylgeranyl diphosphate synthase, type I